MLSKEVSHVSLVACADTTTVPTRARAIETLLIMIPERMDDTCVSGKRRSNRKRVCRLRMMTDWMDGFRHIRETLLYTPPIFKMDMLGIDIAICVGTNL